MLRRSGGPVVMVWFIFSVWLAASLCWLPIVIGNIFIIPRTQRRMNAIVLKAMKENQAEQKRQFEASRRA